MTPHDYQKLLEASREALVVKTRIANEWGLEDFERWDVDQDSREIIFSNDGTMAVAPVQIVGTFNTEDGTWLWSWANDTIDEALTVDAQLVRAYGERHGIDRLVERKWSGSEAEAWDMAALATQLGDGQGAYRGDLGTTYIFMTFGLVNLRSSDASSSS